MATIASKEKPESSKGEPLYRQIAESLREQIRSNKYAPNEALPPQRKLARQFNTSYLTMGFAIELLAQEGLVKRTVGSGTYVQDPRSFSRGLINILTSCDDPFYQSLMFGQIEQELRKARFRPVLFNGRDSYQEELAAFNEMGRFNEAGIIVYSQYLPNFADKLESLRQAGVPAVTISGQSIAGCDCVRVDHRMIGVLQARYLLEQGCRQILFIGIRYSFGSPPLPPPPLPSIALESFNQREPLDGFLSVFIEKGSFLPIRIAYATYESVPTGTQDTARQIAEITRSAFTDPDHPTPDAVAVWNDRYVPAVAEVLKNLGKRIGHDVILVGDDDQKLTGFPYATIDENLAEIGGHAARMLLERIDKVYTGPPRLQIVMPKLVLHP